MTPQFLFKSTTNLFREKESWKASWQTNRGSLTLSTLPVILNCRCTSQILKRNDGPKKNNHIKCVQLYWGPFPSFLRALLITKTRRVSTTTVEFPHAKFAKQERSKRCRKQEKEKVLRFKAAWSEIVPEALLTPNLKRNTQAAGQEA